MCELRGISSSIATEAQDVLRAFRQRGGGSADNPDGWGIAFRVGGRFRLPKGPRARGTQSTLRRAVR